MKRLLVGWLTVLMLSSLGKVNAVANPASVFCEQQGYKIEIRTDSTGAQAGYCVFPDGKECEEWGLYRGVCAPTCTPRLACMDADPACMPDLAIGAPPFCPKVNKTVCNVDTDCRTDAYCYQPPMSPCPEGLRCAQVMPQKTCRTCTPRPACLDGEKDSNGSMVYCAVQSLRDGTSYCPSPKKMAKEGEACGNSFSRTAILQCESGLTCDYSNNIIYQKISGAEIELMKAGGLGICVKNKPKIGEYCGPMTDCGTGAYCYQPSMPPIPKCSESVCPAYSPPMSFCKACVSRPTCLDGVKQSDGRMLYCDARPLPAGISYCPEVRKTVCNVDADCGTSAYCYQPPMSPCPEGLRCAQVMPQKTCRTCTPRLACMDADPACMVKMAAGAPPFCSPSPQKLAKEGEGCGGYSQKGPVLCESGLKCELLSDVLGPFAGVSLYNGKCVKVGLTVNWATKSASFSANDFQIKTSNGKVFRFSSSSLCNKTTGEVSCLNSDPPHLNSDGLNYTTLEVIWFENNVEMRMNIYLYSDGKRWWSNEIRVYNGQPQPNSDWVTFKGKFFDSPVGQTFSQNGFSMDLKEASYSATLSGSNLKVNAFTNYQTVTNGDANGDGKVDLVDFSVWKTEYLAKTSVRADFNGDKKTDLIDFAFWKKGYNNK